MTNVAKAPSPFSAEGLAVLKDGAWVSRTGAAAFFLCAIAVAIGLMLAAAMDRHNAEDLVEVWSDMEHVRPLSWRTSGSTRAEWKNRLLRSVVYGHVALQLGISQASLAILEEARREAPGYAPNLADAEERPLLSLSAQIIKASHLMDQQAESMMKELSLASCTAEGQGRVARAWLILRRVLQLSGRTFLAVHPFSDLVLHDLSTLWTHRTLLWSAQTLGSFLCSALYYQVSGMALSFDNPSECASGTLLSSMNTSVLVALVSLVIAACFCPWLLLGFVSARPRERQIFDHLSTSCLYLSLSALSCVCFTYFAAFLANVDRYTADLWLVTLAWTLIFRALLLPLMQGLVLLPLAVVLLLQEPALVGKVLDKGLPANIVSLEQGECGTCSCSGTETSARFFTSAAPSELAAPGQHLPGTPQNRDVVNFSVIVP